MIALPSRITSSSLPLHKKHRHKCTEKRGLDEYSSFRHPAVPPLIILSRLGKTALWESQKIKGGLK
jgi:hypothetical protein